MGNEIIDFMSQIDGMDGLILICEATPFDELLVTSLARVSGLLQCALEAREDAHKLTGQASLLRGEAEWFLKNDLRVHKPSHLY